MCTALSFNTNDHYFGRNLDLDRSYNEEVCVMPRRFPLVLRSQGLMDDHYAMIGMATVVGDIPLFYDAANEYGLAMAGLNFPGNAHYFPTQPNMDNITPFEFIPWVLGQCKTVNDTRVLLSRLNLVNISFSNNLPLSPLHWMISDRDESIVIESMKDGLHIHNDPVGVLTNNPPFEYHMFNLNNYRGLGVTNGDNIFSSKLQLDNYCQGLGGIGLPGDVSSMSRFVRMTFGSEKSVCKNDEASSVSQFFHLLSSVEMARGVCLTPAEEWDITVYSSCINTDRGLYYYTTYDNRSITCVDMHRTELNGDSVIRFPLITDQQINYQN